MVQWMLLHKSHTHRQIILHGFKDSYSILIILNRYILSIDGSLTTTTTPGQRIFEINNREMVLS